MTQFVQSMIDVSTGPPSVLSLINTTLIAALTVWNTVTMFRHSRKNRPRRDQGGQSVPGDRWHRGQVFPETRCGRRGFTATRCAATTFRITAGRSRF
jgi:predicted lipid-binding transport protein (Tim44 family)